MTQTKAHISLLIIIPILIFTLIRTGTFSYGGSDPRGALLLSQVMISHFSMKLDLYEGAVKRAGFTAHQKNGHYYYYFPVGTSLFSTPFVAISMLTGHDMIKYNWITQRNISGFINIGIFLMLFFTARLYLPPLPSILASFGFWLGTAFSSTLGAALWSHNFSVLFSLIALYLSLKAYKERTAFRWFWISFCLFSAYLCRPTFVLFIPLLLLFIFIFDNKAAFKISGMIGLFMLMFMGVSYMEFHQPLPDYYLPKRLSGGHFQKAFAGNLISPARGLFIYSPFILIPLLFFKKTWGAFKKEKVLLILMIWPILHLITISRFPHWWAGHSFGPRFMVDILPMVFLGLIVSFQSILNGYTFDKNRLVYGLLTITLAFSIYINTVQGLFNRYTLLWNNSPNVDQHPSYLFDWKYPQFLHNKDRHEKRVLEHNGG